MTTYWLGPGGSLWSLPNRSLWFWLEDNFLTIFSCHFDARWGWKESISVLSSTHAGFLKYIHAVVVVERIFAGWVGSVVRNTFKAPNALSYKERHEKGFYGVKYITIHVSPMIPSARSTVRQWWPLFSLDLFCFASFWNWGRTQGRHVWK